MNWIVYSTKRKTLPSRRDNIFLSNLPPSSSISTRSHPFPVLHALLQKVYVVYEMKLYCLSSNALNPPPIFLGMLKTLNPCHVPFVCSCHSSPVLLAELHASNSAVADSANQQNGPDTGDDSTNREYQDVETGDDEWGAGCYDEGLDWGDGLGFCRDDLGCENTIDESSFVRGQVGGYCLAGRVDRTQGDDGDENLLKIRTGNVSIEK